MLLFGVGMKRVLVVLMLLGTGLSGAQAADLTGAADTDGVMRGIDRFCANHAKDEAESPANCRSEQADALQATSEMLDSEKNDPDWLDRIFSCIGRWSADEKDPWQVNWVAVTDCWSQGQTGESKASG